MGKLAEYFNSLIFQCVEFYMIFVYGYLALVYIVYNYTISLIWKKEPDKIENVSQPPPLLSSSEYGSHQYIKLKDVKLHYVESGDKKNPLILMVHGLPDFWFTWRKQIQFLQKDFWVIAVDIRGFGDSDKPLFRYQYSDEAIVGDLLQFLTALGTSKVHVIASGINGQAIWKMAYKHPELIGKLVLIQSPHPYIVRQTALSNWKQFLFKFWYIHLILWPLLPNYFVNKRGYKYLDDILKPLTKSNKVSEEEAECYRYTFLRTGKSDDWIGTINRLRNLDIRNIWFDEEEPDYMIVPTMLIFGDKDPYFPIETAHRTAEFVERIQVKPIHNSCGRWLHITNSSEVNTLIEKFLLGNKKRVKTDKIDATQPTLVGRMMGAGISAVSNTVSKATRSTGLLTAAHTTYSTLKAPSSIWS